jgi:hypothetical protein
MKRIICSIVATIASSLLTASIVHAQWRQGGAVVSAAPNDQNQCVATADGLGGAIVTWYDTRNGTSSIYARKIDRYGVPQWTTDGVAICTATNIQDLPQIASDGAGGAIITWEDKRSGAFDIYAQRVNASGVVQWTPNGVGVSTAVNSQEAPQILADGAGGAFIVWSDFRSGGSNYDIYGARVTNAGNVLWGTNGAAICTAVNIQNHPALVSDGVGGLFIAWEDNRGINTDIYMQDVNAAGLGIWTSNGIPVCTELDGQYVPQIVTDGAGDAIVAWTDYRNYPPSVFVQRVTSVGVPWWTYDGVEVTDINEWVTGPSIVSDGQGGVIVVYQQQYTYGDPFDLYAQRINAAGIRLWYQLGVNVSLEGGSQVLPRAVTDDAGGIIVAWVDDRMTLDDIYAQRIDGSGKALWLDNGVRLTYGYGARPTVSLVNDGMGGSIAAWYHSPSSMGTDIESQRIDNVFGYWGYPEPVITSVADVSADQGGRVKVNWRASDHDRETIQTILFYSVWRATDPAAASAVGATVIDNLAEISADSNGKVFLREHSPTSDYYWELVGSQGATLDRAYSFAAVTRADSVAGHPSIHQFRVVAHTTDDFVLFRSRPASGYSVDNLSPPPPFMLIAQRAGPDVHLQWNRSNAPDLRAYSIYRKTSSGVTPVPLNFLADSDDTLAVDAGAPASALYYIVTARDVHANQSAPSNEASVSALTGVGQTPPLTELRVLPNHPNPFSASTELEIGLPSPSDVSIEVFDAAGRRVSETLARGQSAGWRRITLPAIDSGGKPLASGVYFYRVRADGRTITRKMVIAR